MVIVQVMDKKTGFGSFTSISRAQFLKDGATLTPAAPLSLTLVVKAEDGAPIRDAKIVLAAMLGRVPDLVGELRTDVNGVAGFDKFYTGGAYYVSCSAKGYYTSEFHDAKIGGKGWTGTKEIVLRKADYAAGRVVDAFGKPVPSASVEIIGQSNISTNCDADGAFRMQLPPAGERSGRVMVMISGQQGPDKIVLKATDPITKRGVYERIDREELVRGGVSVTLHRARTLTVSVKDENGRPLKDAEVIALAYIGTVVDDSVELRTDKNGLATFPGVYHGGEYLVHARLQGYYYEPKPPLAAVGSEGWNDRIVLTMERRDRIQRGTVVDEAGNPVRGAKVACYMDGEVSVTTDAQGRFTLSGMPKSAIDLSATGGGLSGRAKASKDSPEVEIKIAKQEVR